MLAERRVQQQLDIAREEKVDDVGSPLVHLQHGLARDTTSSQVAGGSFRSHDLESEFVESTYDRRSRGFVAVVHGHDDPSAEG